MSTSCSRPISDYKVLTTEQGAQSAHVPISEHNVLTADSDHNVLTADSEHKALTAD